MSDDPPDGRGGHPSKAFAPDSKSATALAPDALPKEPTTLDETPQKFSAATSLGSKAPPVPAGSKPNVAAPLLDGLPSKSTAAEVGVEAFGGKPNHNGNLVRTGVIGALAGGLVAGVVQLFVSDQAGADAALRKKVAEFETKIASFASAQTLSPIEARLAAVEKSLQSMQLKLNLLADKPTPASDVVNVDTAVLNTTAIEERLARIEAAMATPKSEARVTAAPENPPPPAQANVGLAVASLALAQAVEQNRTYESELAAVEALGADPAQIKLLRPAASTGVKTIRNLAEDFAVRINPMLASLDAAPPENALDRLALSASRLVRIRPVGDVRGSEPAALVAKIEAALARGGLVEALQGWSTLPEPARSASAKWETDARARADAIAGAQGLVSQAVSKLSKSKS